MATLILDIETVGESWENLDETTQTELTRWIKQNIRDQEEREWQLENIKSSLGLSPCTGFVVALGIYDLEREHGVVYYIDEKASKDWRESDFAFKPRGEETILKEFWEGLSHYDTVVTFAGRRFDLPFLIHRSLAHQLTPSANLLGQRFLARQTPPYHVDLQEELTFYGVMNKRPSLHMFCRTYGIKSSKTAVSGQNVATLFKDRQGSTIARYNAEDLLATKELFLHWQKYLAPEFFKIHT